MSGEGTFPVADVTKAEFWQHGYRTGYRHAVEHFPNILDDERTFPDADVIDLRTWLLARAAAQ